VRSGSTATGPAVNTSPVSAFSRRRRNFGPSAKTAEVKVPPSAR